MSEVAANLIDRSIRTNQSTADQLDEVLAQLSILGPSRSRTLLSYLYHSRLLLTPHRDSVRPQFEAMLRDEHDFSKLCGHLGLMDLCLTEHSTPEALLHRREARLLNSRVTDPYLEIRLLLLEGILFSRLMDDAAAVQSYQLAANKSLEGGYPKAEASAHHFLAEFYLTHEAYDKALVHNRAHQQLIDPGLTHHVLQSRIQELTILLELKEYAEVEERFASVSRPQPGPFEIVLLMLDARLAAANDNRERFYRSIREAEDLCRAEKKLRLVSNLYATAAEVVLSWNEAAEALEWSERAIQAAEEATDNQMLAQALGLGYDAAKRLGRIQQAFTYLERLNELTTSRKAAELEHTLALLDFQSQVQQQQRELAAEAEARNLVERELSVATQRVTERIRFLIRQSEDLNQLRHELEAILRSAPATSELAQKVARKLRELPGPGESERMVFEEFDAADPTFHKRLLGQAPDLTAQQLRIAQLLRLQLKTYEIAQLLSISERSVETHRLNIRKKLGLRREQSLTAFLVAL